MVTNLLVPDRRIVVPKPPSYLKLDMAFAIGAGAKLMDKSRYRSHGTISGAAWATGLHGKALDFVSATPSYVGIPAAYDQLDFTSEAFSIIARIYADAVSAWAVIFNRGRHDNDGYRFIIAPTAKLHFLTSQASASQETYSGNNAIAAGAWYTVGLSRNGADVRLYSNGVDVTAGTPNHTNPLTSSREALIGVGFNLALYPFDGKIEFLRVFGGIALPASAHLAWHNALA